MAETATRLGRYEIRGELGRGAMGNVFDAWDPVIERRVALKTIRPDQLEGQEVEDLKSRFLQEAKAAGRINHPNVVSIYEYGDDQGTAYIAMEFVEGRDLKSLLDSGDTPPLNDSVRIVIDVLAALGAAHEKGIVHRDVKPGNVFVQPNGRAKVTDFGIARLESSNLTMVGCVIGTPAFMSPEQAGGQRVDHRSDLFSAGVILYQLITGRKPFSGSSLTVMHKILTEEPPPPSSIATGLPEAYDRILRTALAKSPDQRFADARQFIAALEAALRSAPTDTDATFIPAAPPPAPGPQQGSRPESPLPAALRPGPTPNANRNRAVGLALVALATLGIALGAYRMSASPPTAANPAPHELPAGSLAAPGPKSPQPASPTSAPEDKSAVPPQPEPQASQSPAPVSMGESPKADGQAKIPAQPTKTTAKPRRPDSAEPSTSVLPQPAHNSAKSTAAMARERSAVSSAAEASCPGCNCADLMTRLSIGIEPLTPPQRDFYRQYCR